MTKEKDYEITTGSVFAALCPDQGDELLARAKLLDQVSTLIKKTAFLNNKKTRDNTTKRISFSEWASISF